MSTELILVHGNGRVRVVYQHAPVWEAGIEPGSCPPQGLKLFRIMVSQETLNTVRLVLPLEKVKRKVENWVKKREVILSF